jgi:hypothetical protein
MTPPPNPLAAALRAANTTEVVISPFDAIRWRVRKVNTAMLAEAHQARVLALREQDARRASVPEGQPVPPPPPEEVARQNAFADAVLAQGVVECDLGEGWFAPTIVCRPEERDEAAGKLLPSEDFPPGLPMALMLEILKLSGDGEGAAKRIATFLGKPAAP